MECFKYSRRATSRKALNGKIDEMIQWQRERARQRETERDCEMGLKKQRVEPQPEEKKRDNCSGNLTSHVLLECITYTKRGWGGDWMVR